MLISPPFTGAYCVQWRLIWTVMSQTGSISDHITLQILFEEVVVTLLGVPRDFSMVRGQTVNRVAQQVN
jgi:hypothetical protein